MFKLQIMSMYVKLLTDNNIISGVTQGFSFIAYMPMTLNLI